MAVKSLKKLDLSPSASLNSLHPGLVNLTLLQEVNCYQCFKLKSPPYAVCVQGLEAIIKYYRDLAKERSIEQPIISAAVIGNRMAGKTSLIRSLMERKRVLTYRNESSDRDETTKAFQVNEVDLGETKLRMFDFGGDTVYHLSYQMAIRDNYIPIVVINMQQFDELSSLTPTPCLDPQGYAHTSKTSTAQATTCRCC